MTFYYSHRSVPCLAIIRKPSLEWEGTNIETHNCTVCGEWETLGQLSPKCKVFIKPQASENSAEEEAEGMEGT